MDLTQIQEHMPVVGSDGEHVGTVDKVEGDRIKLTKSDPASGGEHRYIALDQVEAVEDGEVHLMVSGAEARSAAMAE